MDIEGKVAVVTGGASGIGRAIVMELVRRGADVAVADLHELRLEEVRTEVEALGRRALTLRVDVAFDDDVEHFEREVMEEYGRVDIVVNNAGVGVVGPPERMSMEDWDWVLQVNLYGVIRGVRAFVPHLLRQGSGHVVNTASLAGLWAQSWETIPYVTSKFGVVGLTEGLALYLKPHGIGVSVLCPGWIETNIAETVRFGGLEDPADWPIADPIAEVLPPDVVGGLVCDAIRDNRYLVLTHPEFTRAHVESRAADYDGFIDRMIASIPPAPNLHRDT